MSSNTKLLCGVVTKGVGGVFTVQSENGKYTCFSPKKLRYNDCDILVGDKVTFCDLHKGKGNILEVLPRKNRLHRPEIANVDVCFVVLSIEPQPDLFLADKILVSCFQQKIEPVVVINKMDIDNGVAEQIRQNYAAVCDVVQVSAFDEDSVKQLYKYIDGRLACFAGQSAVGKTSLLNVLLPELNGKTGNLSEKTGRGMHTTRHSSLHKIGNGYVADTCGFSLCNLQDVRSEDLRLYFDDFVSLSDGCKFHSCTHTAEPDCAVKRAYEEGRLCRGRYERYLEEYKELVEFEKNQY